MLDDRPLRLSLPLLLVLILGGCTGRYDYMVPETSVEPPEAFASAPASASRRTETVPWWVKFRDPALTALIEQAFEGNLDLKASWARLRQSGAGARITRAAEQPTVDLTASSGRTQFFLPGRGATVNVRNSVQLPVSWEVDLFGKLNAATAAARLDAVASRRDVEALALSLSAEITSTYVGLKEQRARRLLLTEQLETNRDLLDSLRVRYTQGQSSSLDYYQQEQLVQGRRAQLQLIDGEEARLANRLAVLIGEVPGSYQPPPGDELPELPLLPALGIPADLLQRRPDLLASLHRVEAADRRVAEAIRDRLPGIRISPSLSYQVKHPSDLFRNLLRGISGSISLPIFDGGRRRAKVEQNRAVVDERLAQYSQGFLLALEEVESALAQEKQQKEYLAELEAQERTVRRSFSIATARYQEGVEDFIRVLTALGTLQQIQESLVQGRAQLLRYRIQLCRALGGGWTGRLVEAARKPTDSTPEPTTESEGNA